MDKVTRKSNRRRDFRRRVQAAVRSGMMAMRQVVLQVDGMPEVTARPWSASPEFTPKRSDKIKRKRAEAHNKRSKRK